MSTPLPSLIRLLNASRILSYQCCLERPGNFQSKTYLQYQFACQSHSLGQYNCELSLQKIPTESSGLQHTQSEYVLKHRIRLVQINDSEWIWYCRKLNEQIHLDPPIVVPCRYSARTGDWRIEGTYRDINSLFTLNQFGEGLGMWAQAFAKKHTVVISCTLPELQIHSFFLSIPLVHSSRYDGFFDRTGDLDNSATQGDEENPASDRLKDWKLAVGESVMN